MGSIVTIQGPETTTGAYLTLPRGSGPGVIVLHDWFGLLLHIQQHCDELAGAGLVALAPDLYQGRTTTDTGEAEALADGLGLEDARGRIDAANS